MDKVRPELLQLVEIGAVLDQGEEEEAPNLLQA
jgi:hypothetical protein